MFKGTGLEETNFDYQTMVYDTRECVNIFQKHYEQLDHGLLNFTLVPSWYSFLLGKKFDLNLIVPDITFP